MAVENLDIQPTRYFYFKNISGLKKTSLKQTQKVNWGEKLSNEWLNGGLRAHLSPNRNSRQLLKVSTAAAAQVNIHPPIHPPTRTVGPTRSHPCGYLDLRCVLPPQLGFKRRILFTVGVGVGVGVGVSPHHVSSSFLFVELRGGSLLCLAFLSHRLTCPAPRNLPDRSDTPGAWKNRENVPSINNSVHRWAAPGRRWRLRGSHGTQVIHAWLRQVFDPAVGRVTQFWAGLLCLRRIM